MPPSAPRADSLSCGHARRRAECRHALRRIVLRVRRRCSELGACAERRPVLFRGRRRDRGRSRHRLEPRLGRALVQPRGPGRHYAQLDQRQRHHVRHPRAPHPARAAHPVGPTRKQLGSGVHRHPGGSEHVGRVRSARQTSRIFCSPAHHATGSALLGGTIDAIVRHRARPPRRELPAHRPAIRPKRIPPRRRARRTPCALAPPCSSRMRRRRPACNMHSPS